MTCGEGMESRYLGRGLPCSAIQCVGAAFLTAHPPMGANSSRHLGEGQLLPPRGPAASVLPIHCQVRSHAQLPNTVSGQSASHRPRDHMGVHLWTVDCLVSENPHPDRLPPQGDAGTPGGLDFCLDRVPNSLGCSVVRRHHAAVQGVAGSPPV